MAKQRNALRAGVFMMLSVAMMIFVIVAISGAGRFTQRFNTYPVEFSLSDDVGGLRVGDEVRIGGLKMGDVRDIQIRQVAAVGDEPKHPAVVVFIDLPAKFVIGADAGVSVQRTLTGAAAINVDSLGGDAPLGAGEYLRGRPDPLNGLIANLKVASVRLNTDLEKLGDTADSFTMTGFSATQTVQDLHVRLPEIVARYDEVCEAAVRMLGTVHALLGPSTGDFHATISNLRGISADLHEKLPGILDRLHGILGDADIAVGRAAQAMADIEATASNARDVTRSLRSIVVDNRSRLDGIIASLNATSENLKYASIEIRHSPWRLLYQPKPDEMSNLNIYDSVRQFAQGADSLDDAAGALRDALHDKNADPQQVKKLMDHLNDTFTQFQQVEQKMWSAIKQ
jgi:ABC-type transporter Mla subunit MlaD